MVLILTMLSSDLILRNDNLHTIAIIRIRNRMFQEADRSDDLRFFQHSFLLAILVIQEVGRVTDAHLRLYSLALRLDADKFAFFVVYDLFDGFVEHVCAAVDCGETSEALWKLA